jgi:hypothetical protein
MSRSYFHDEHLKYGYVGSENDYVPEGVFYVKVEASPEPPLSPLEEARKAALLIEERARKSGQPILLYLSGGIDSECMAIAFLKAGVPFIPVVIRFNDGLNAHDIVDAFEFCKRAGLTPRVFDLDIPEFYRSEKHVEYAHLYRCTSPQLAVHIHVMKELRGFPVLAGNALSFVPHATRGLGVNLPSDLYFCYHRFFDREGIDGVAFFLMYTSGLLHSFLALPEMRKYLKFPEVLPKETEEASYRLKCQIYRAGGFDVRDRKDKYTGFEYVKEYYLSLGEKGGDFNALFRWPLVERYPHPRECLSILPRHVLSPEPV